MVLLTAGADGAVTLGIMPKGECHYVILWDWEPGEGDEDRAWLEVPGTGHVWEIGSFGTGTMGGLVVRPSGSTAMSAMEMYHQAGMTMDGDDPGIGELPYVVSYKADPFHPVAMAPGMHNWTGMAVVRDPTCRRPVPETGSTLAALLLAFAGLVGWRRWTA